MLQAILGIVPNVLKLADKMILDKDKKAEFAFKTLEMQNQLIEKLVTMETIPWVDATVKLFGAVVMLGRPIGSFLLTAFGVYAQYKGIELSDAATTVTLGAFPAWMGAREVHKTRVARIKEKEVEQKIPFLGEDY
ncbi:MAG: hypothetical protein D6698_15075 [Gammaproteobacteria bacterium]|nr:MAG: hypothetical protein D6698_15075 [Gammaproteobacteria bacterium]